MSEEKLNLNKLVLHPKFNDTINELNRLRIQLPEHPLQTDLDFHLYNFPDNGEIITNIEEIKSYTLNAKKGQKLSRGEIIISAYDESINKFSSLEGEAVLISHSQVIHRTYDYIPSNYLTFYFYTRSKNYAQKSRYIKYSKEPEIESKKDYAIDRTLFIENNTPNNAIMFIDWPLIGKQMSSYTIELNNNLLKKNVVPIFFIKNSSSDLVTSHIKEIKNEYNSDMHWAFNFLKVGQRTNFFKYVDKYNKQNGKIFCYLKTFNVSPQRVEFHINTFKKYQDLLSDLMDLIYYLQLVQGDPKDPQLRTIKIAEKYARETLKLINLTSLMRRAGIVPTINQERFGFG